MATGILQSGLRLFELNCAIDVAKLKIEPQHFRGKWLTGFGWDQSKWPDQKFPNKEILDAIFPDFPVALSRADGHATWLNSKALAEVGYLNQTESQKATPDGGVISRDACGLPTGIFFESAKIQVELKIPDYLPSQKKEFLQSAIQYFNQRGFSHLRDMSGSIEQWNLLRDLDLSHQLSLYVEENFTCENLQDFERALSEACVARQSETSHLKARGIKFYFDGSLGSQGAFLSQFYPGTDSRGLTLWPLEDVAEAMTKTWKEGFEVCVHTIGDEAAHLILQTATNLKREKNVTGILNLEHCEVVRPETIQLMKNLTVVSHIQPCHWLSDRRWLREKLGNLWTSAFPWKSIWESHIPIQWGSDSPIEEASVANNLRALQESSEDGIPGFPENPLTPHSHRESGWGAGCHSVFQNGKLSQLVFDGKVILQP